MQPDGTNSADSFPKISAARSSSRLTVGSSPYTSSPTSASAIARRISAVGRVTVSLRRSTIPSIRFTSSGSLRIPVFAIVALTFPSPSAPSPQQFHKHFIRNTQPPRRKSHHVAIPLYQSRRRQRRKPPRQIHLILPLDPRNVDPVQLPQPEKQLFLQRLLRRHLLQLLDQHSPTLQRAHISRRIVRVRPSLRPRKRMRSRAKSQVRLPPPVFQIVPRFEPRLSPIRNFVVVISHPGQKFLRRFIKIRHLIFARQRPGAVSCPVLQHFPSQPASFINLQQVNRHVLRRKRAQFLERLPPAFFRLVRQTRNQIEADVSNSRLAQDRDSPINIRAPVQAPRRRQLFVRKRLHPKTYSSDSRPYPCRSFFRFNRFLIRLQRHLSEFRAETRSNRMEQLLKIPRLQQARRPPADVNGIHDRFL